MTKIFVQLFPHCSSLTWTLYTLCPEVRNYFEMIRGNFCDRIETPKGKCGSLLTITVFRLDGAAAVQYGMPQES